MARCVSGQANHCSCGRAAPSIVTHQLGDAFKTRARFKSVKCLRYALVQAFRSCSEADWPDSLPTVGILSCHFACGRLRRFVPHVEDRRLNAMLQQLRAPSMSDKERLSVVNTLTGNAYVTCKQVCARACVRDATIISPCLPALSHP